MYLMALGSRPVGECFIQLPEQDGDDGWLIAQYYDGSSVKLLQFKEPLEEPEEGSIEHRVKKADEDMFYLKQYVEKFIKDLCEATGVEFKTFEEWLPEATPPAGDSGEGEGTEAKYFITSFDTYRKKRGW